MKNCSEEGLLSKNLFGKGIEYGASKLQSDIKQPRTNKL